MIAGQKEKAERQIKLDALRIPTTDLIDAINEQQDN
jgi:hypothetical protein